MAKHYSLGVYDYDQNKVCELYDSEVELVGQAFDIKYSVDMNGYHTLDFSIPYMIDGAKVVGSDIESLYGSAIYGINKFGTSGGGNIKLRNYRWDYLRSDYLIRYTCGNQNVWFVANKPVKSKSSKKIVGSVACSGFESLLKTRNIYMIFDDENGIGNIEYLMDQILLGTGWSYDDTHSDTLVEKDGITEKVRSLSSDGKKGALDLISTVCNLFQARPIFDTDAKTVTIKAMNNRQQVLEGEVGRNLTALNVTQNSSNISTRVYVEGEYGDYGYVGIDDVKVDENGNPDEEGTAWGLPFILNFDYYRQLGVFKPSHEAALATYLTNIRGKKAEISAKGAELIACEDAINQLIGQCKCVVYYKDESLVTPVHNYGGCTPEQAALATDDDVVILRDNGTISYEKWTGQGAPQLANAYGVVKFVTKAAGKIGAAEVQIEAKEKEIVKLKRKINVLVQGDAKIPEYEKEIARLQNEIDAIFVGYQPYDESSPYDVGDYCMHNSSPYGDTHTYLTAMAYECVTAIPQPEPVHTWNPNEWNETGFVGLFKMMHDIMSPTGMFYDYDVLNDELSALNAEQDDIEATFIAAMGYMLRDGYWSNQNYTIGQETFLYMDAVDMSKEMSHPTTEITFSYVRLTEEYDIQPEDIEINAIFRIWDEDLNVFESMFIKKITYGVDNKELGSIEVSNQDIALTGNDLSTLLSRMSQLADLIEQKNALYERAKIISESGSIYADRLNGQIDVMKNQILSSVSNWHTDDNGNIIFVSADESSAMMLSGAGFMLANGKDDNGEWSWRTLGDGKGISADEIVTGFLSADRIEAGSITTSKLSSDVGTSLNLSSNTSINAKIEQSVADAEADITNNVSTMIAEAELTPEEFSVMFGETVKPDVDSSIAEVQTNLDNYQQGVSNYMRYDNTGTLTLGKTDNNFQTQLTNTKMAFMEGSSEVAYISNQSMFITTARVTDTLSLGTNNGYGYFDWVVTPTGLGLKWRDPGFGGIKVTMRFSGISTVPANFYISNNYNNSIFNAANAEAGNGITEPFEWTINGIQERTAVTFTQHDVDVSGYTRTGSETTITSDTVLTDVVITTPFTNVYTPTT